MKPTTTHKKYWIRRIAILALAVTATFGVVFMVAAAGEEAKPLPTSAGGQVKQFQTSGRLEGFPAIVIIVPRDDGDGPTPDPTTPAPPPDESDHSPHDNPPAAPAGNESPTPDPHGDELHPSETHEPQIAPPTEEPDEIVVIVP